MSWHSSRRTSASSTTRFPSGQMTWSTWERTRSQVSSGVRRLVCKSRRKRLESWREDGGADAGVEAAGRLTTSISVLEWPMLHTMQLFFIRSRCSLVTTFLFPAGREGRDEPKAVEIQTL